MEKNRMGLIKRLKTLIATALVMFAAVLTVSTGARVALADEPMFKSTPLCDEPGYESIKDAPGFKWVAPEGDEPGHYLIYNPVEGYEGSHESGIGWWYFALYSRTSDFDGYLIRLASDLSFAQYNFNRNGGDPNQLSVGSEDLPFSGTFDGCGYTISNLTNERSGLSIQMDNGFFGWTREATIKNINFNNCYIGGSYRDGLVAGYAQDTFFLNILCEDCTTSVIPANNVLNLVTNAGISGGTIAGVANGCTLYNCEMRAGRVVTNATAGVAALGGQPLYMGGLVGQANDTTIEYCRVTDKWVTNEEGARVRDYAEVSGTYETAVSVANYSEVYVGGIVGGMQKEDTGTKVVDCYSTADVYGKAAIYFGVGLGLGVTRAYCGGIAGIVWDNGNGENVIERVHYAGNLHSYQYNQLLLGIPIIQHDAYMGGIVSVGGGNATINQAYFKRGASSTDKQILVFQNWTTDTDGPENGTVYGPRDDDYTNRDFWESLDYDFAKGTLRNEGYTYTKDVFESEWSENHYNKWAMDYERGIPVHSGSIKATMDFPGSGTVTIGTTTLSNNDESEPYKGWLTSDPYDFAVQGYTEGAANENDEDFQIDIDYTFTEEKNDSWAADDQNEGFRFMGWYGTRDVKVNNLPQQHSLFTTPNSTLNTESGLISGDTYLWQENKNDNAPDKLTVKYPERPDDLQKLDYADNDLYVAHAQAQVLLHNTDKEIIHHNESGEIVGEGFEGVSDDWFDYEQSFTLPSEIPAEFKGNALASDSATLIGWTTDPTYMNVLTSDKIDEAKRKGLFFEVGSAYTVTEPVNLYPVYSDYISNINVIYEGHDMDATDNKLVRDNFGKAEIIADDGSYSIKVTLDPKEPIDAGSMRFIGWYEEMDPGNPETEVRVSSDEEFSLDGVDLTRPHTYTARFEYRVQYLYEADGDEYATEWRRYDDSFTNYEDLSASDDAFQAFEGWRAGVNCDDVVGDSRTSNANLTPDFDLSGYLAKESTDGSPNTYPIRYPMAVHAHWQDNQGVDNLDMIFTTDFPGAADMKHSGSGLTWDVATVEAHAYQKPDFNLYGWTGENEDGVEYSAGATRGWMVALGLDKTPASGYEASSSWEKKYWNPGRQYWHEVRSSADVTFHMPTAVQEKNVTVERAYRSPVFMAETTTHAFAFSLPVNANKDVSSYGMAGVENSDELSAMTTSFEQDASPSDQTMRGSENDPTVENAVFIGWINADELSAYEFGYVFDGAELGNGVKLVSNISHALPYVHSSSDTELLCYGPIDLYPVYVSFDLDTTTNIAESDVDTSIYNVPLDPSIVDGDIKESIGSLQVTFNDDQKATVSGQAVETITYNDAYEAAVKVTVDSDQKVWKDEAQGDDVYTFTSLSVYENGVLTETIPASDFSGSDGTLTTNEAILILVGHSYKFVANYSPVPVMVTYHYNYDGDDGSTESFSTEVGQVLPTPTGTPSFSRYENAFVVGWTEGDADGSPANYADNPTILTPGSDVVTGTMHLWPVYRTGSFVVNSNIDTEAGTDHRGWNKTADGQGAELWAQPNVTVGTTRYTFQGWTTKWETDGENDGIERTSTTWTLYGNDRFPDPKVTYTAIYAEVSEIRYHDTDGNVIYTASVTADDDRTFVSTTTVDIPQYNEDGTPVIDETTGEQVTKPTEITTPIDSQAFTAIAAAIDNRNAAEDAESYEQFVAWQWVKSDGSVERWGDELDNFVNESAISNMTDGHMDLYPVTMRLEATDTKNLPYTGLTTQLSLDEKTNALTKAMITLQSSYNQEWLKVHIDEVAYVPGNETVETPQTIIPVELYTPGSQIGSPVATDTTRDTNDNTGATQLVPGDALFTFSGRITITKTSTDASVAGRVFSFTVRDAKDVEARTVIVQMPDKPTNGAYTAKATISVPFGQYTVAEDSDWAWRYDATVRHWELDTDVNTAGNQSGWTEDGEVTVEFDEAPSAYNPDSVTSAVMITNALTNGTWLDGEVIAHNVFGIPTGGPNAENGGE